MSEERREEGNVKEILKAMTPEQRAQWAKEQGADGVLKLMELQEDEMEQKFQFMELKQKQMLLDTIAEEWVKEHKDLFKDERIAKVAKGLDLSLLKEKGVESYVELTPKQLKEHLNDVETLIEEIVSGKKSEKSVDETSEGDDKEKKDGRGNKSLSDMTGKGGDAGGFSTEVNLEKLSAIASNDPFSFEEAVSQMSDNKLFELMRQSEAAG